MEEMVEETSEKPFERNSQYLKKIYVYLHFSTLIDVAQEQNIEETKS